MHVVLTFTGGPAAGSGREFFRTLQCRVLPMVLDSPRRGNEAFSYLNRGSQLIISGDYLKANAAYVAEANSLKGTVG